MQVHTSIVDGINNCLPHLIHIKSYRNRAYEIRFHFIMFVLNMDILYRGESMSFRFSDENIIFLITLAILCLCEILDFILDVEKKIIS